MVKRIILKWGSLWTIWNSEFCWYEANLLTTNQEEKIESEESQGTLPPHGSKRVVNIVRSCHTQERQSEDGKGREHGYEDPPHRTHPGVPWEKSRSAAEVWNRRDQGQGADQDVCWCDQHVDTGGQVLGFGLRDEEFEGNKIGGYSDYEAEDQSSAEADVCCAADFQWSLMKCRHHMQFAAFSLQIW